MRGIDERRSPGAAAGSCRGTGGRRFPLGAARWLLGAALAAGFLLPGVAPQALAQTGAPFNQRDDTYPLLGLKRAREAYEFARANLERKTQMHEKGLITAEELAAARNAFADAEVNYQQSLLAVLFERQFVSVVEAVKYQARDGSKHVRLKIANASAGGAELRKLGDVEDEIFRSLQPDIINDVYVSLLNDAGAIISQPYEVKVEELRYGSPATIDFTLLQDMDALTVDIIYGNGSRRTPKILLQKDSTAGKVLVQSKQFSQEVELGGTASFDLTLELFSSASNTVKLEVVGLPAEISRFFVDGGGEARLSQLKFTERANSMQAALKVYLPDRASSEVVIGQPIPFFVLAVPQGRRAAAADSAGRRWTEEEVQALGVGYARLEIVPRGMGKLLVRAPQLYQSVKRGEEAAMQIVLVNEGTRRLDNVEMEVDAPFGWQKRIEPALIASLGVREEREVRLVFTPPADVGVGRYEFRIRSSSLSDNAPIRGEDKVATVEVEARANVAGTVALVLLILGIVGGIVAFGVRISRR